MIAPELIILGVAASPIVELRGAIPLALHVYEMPIWSSYLFAVAGNLIPILSIPFLGRLSNWLSLRSKVCRKFFEWLFARTRKRHEQKFAKYRDLILIFLVAIPLPFTGAWTGSVVAFVFGIPFVRAFPLIAIGVIIAGVLVTALNLGIIHIV
jgi:uncharacterized membrane protein